MSSIPAEEVSRIIVSWQDARTYTYCSLAALALLAFEWPLTLSREVELYWKDRLTVAKVLFIWNRYLPIVVLVTDFCGSSGYTDQSCTAQFYAYATLESLQYMPWAIFAAVRAYVLSGRRWYLAAFTLFLSSMPFILNGVHFMFDKWAYEPRLGCTAVRTVPPTIHLALTIVSRSSLIIADALVVAVTWHTTYSTVRLLDTQNRRHSPFSRLFLVNGTVYFVILCTLNALQLAFTLCSIVTDSFINGGASYLVAFTEPITAILVSRFLLQLQEVNTRSTSEGSLGEISSITFGCLSSELEPGDVWDDGEVPGEELRENTSSVQEINNESTDRPTPAP